MCLCYNKEIILGADGDTEKCIITCIIKDENYELNNEDVNSKDFKPTGQKRVLCLAKADGIPVRGQKLMKEENQPMAEVGGCLVT